ncbi:hypothetical protein ABW21_db0204148 [Orbilia brochopaga]|nr:hypothetical protein ABW21_db0204148 [Drechslerella brochopaga]
MASSDTVITRGMTFADVFHLLKAKFELPLAPVHFTKESVGEDLYGYFCRVKFLAAYGKRNLSRAITSFEQFANYENLADEVVAKATSVRSSRKRQLAIQEKRLEAFNQELWQQIQIFLREGGSIATQGSSRQSIISVPPNGQNMEDRSSSYRSSTQIRDRQVQQRVLEWQTRNESAGSSGRRTNHRASLALDASEAELFNGLDLGRSVDNDEEIHEAFPAYIEEPTEIDDIIDESGLLPVSVANMPGGFPESTGSRSETNSPSNGRASSRRLHNIHPSLPPHPPVHSPPSKHITSKNYNWGTYVPPDVDTGPAAASSSPRKPLASASSFKPQPASRSASSSSSMNHSSDHDEEKKRKRVAPVRPAHGQLTQQPKDSSSERPAKRHSPRISHVQPPPPSPTATAVSFGRQGSRVRSDENHRRSPSYPDLRRDESFSTAASQRTSFGFQPSFDNTQPTSFNSTMEGKNASVDAEEGAQTSFAEMLPPAIPPHAQRQQSMSSTSTLSNVPMKSRSIVRQRQYSPPSAQLLRESMDHSSRASSRSSAKYSVGASTERDMMELVASTAHGSSASKPAPPNESSAAPPSALDALTSKDPTAVPATVTSGFVPGRAARYMLYDTLAGDAFPGDHSSLFNELHAPFWLQYEATRVLLGTLEKDMSKHESDIKNLVRKISAGQSLSYENAEMISRETFAGYTSEESYVTRKTLCARDVYESVRTSERKWDDRIQLTAELKFERVKHPILNGKVCRPTIRLKPLNLQNATSRFSRNFGSHRFLVLRVPQPKSLKIDPSDYTQIVDDFLIESGFKLLSRTWKAMYHRESKDSKGEKNGKEDHDWHTLVLFAEEGLGLDPVSVKEAMEWLIPIESNLHQTECKFWSRIKLGFSTTTPTVVFDTLDYIEDIKVGNNCLTDGCGLVSPAVLRRIKTHLGLSYVPSAVQARIGPAKGLFVADPKAPVDSDEVWIKIRGDQKKFEGISDDAAHRTLDINGISSPLSPSALNRQFLPILLQNGVPFEVFADLLREDIRRQIGELLESGRLDDPIFLRGYVERIKLLASRHRYDTIPTMGRAPKSQGERVVFWLEGGFTLENPMVRKSFLEILDDYCADIEQKMHITIPKSCTAFCVADPSGKLKEGQVYLRFSDPRSFVDEKTMLPTDIVLGDVLVARNPAHFASDIQRVTAVDVPELRHLTDVIVFSADPDTCDRSLADYLSGGDYDGDRVWTCWDQRVVGPYVNSQNGPQNVNITGYLTKDISTMRSRFSSKHSERPHVFTDFVKARIKNIMQEVLVGRCTGFYDRVVYKYWSDDHKEGGINHREAVRLAALCCSLLDAPKQGDEIRPQTWKVFDQRYRNLPQPLYKSPKASSEAGTKSEFPLDKLRFRVAPAEMHSLMDRLKGQLPPVEQYKDADLIGYYDKFEHRWEQIKKTHASSPEKGPKFWGARAVLRNLLYLNEKLQDLLLVWKDYYDSGGPNDPDIPPTDLIEDWAYSGRERFSEWSKIRAAALYRKCNQQSTLPWAMAADDLVLIKLLAISADPIRSIRFMREDMYISLKTKASAMAKTDESIWIDSPSADGTAEELDNVDWDD